MSELFDGLNGKASLKSLLSDWTDEYTAEKVKDLANCMLLLSGLPTTNLDHLDFTADFSKTIQIKIKSARLKEFWSKLIDCIKKEVLFGDCLDLLLDWIGVFSSSVFRPLRYNATVAALQIMSGVSNVSRALASEHAKLSHSKRSAIDRIDNLNTKLANIFAHRYRDIDPAIRQECIRHLSNWVLDCPDTFLDTRFIRHFGLMLYDSSENVRLESIRGLSRVYNDLALQPGLGTFSERFKERIIQMASMEKSVNIRQEAVKVLIQIGTLGYFDSVDNDKIILLLFDFDAKVRTTIAPFAADIFIQDYLNPFLSQIEENDSIPFASLKVFAQFLLKISSLVNKLSPIDTIERNNASSLDLRQLEGPFDLTEKFAAADEDQRILRHWLAASFTDLSLGFCQNRIHEADASTFCEYLTTDFTTSDPNANPSALLLQKDQETCLLHMLISLIRLKSTANSKRKRDAKLPMFDVVMDYANVLFERYGTENTVHSQVNLLNAISLVQMIPLSSYSELHKQTAFVDTFKQTAKLYAKQSSKQVIVGIAKLLGHFIQKDGNPFIDTAEDLFQDLFNKLLGDLVDAMNIAKDSLDDNDFGNLLGKVYAIYGLCLQENIFRYPAAKDCSFDEELGIFGVMYSVIELSLGFLKHSQESSNQAGMITAVCIFETALRTMFVELSYDLNDIYIEKKESEGMMEKIQKLSKFCEAIASSTGGFGIKFDDPMRLAALQVLWALYPLTNSSFAKEINMELKPDLNVQRGGCELLGKVIDHIQDLPLCSEFKDQIEKLVAVSFRLGCDGTFTLASLSHLAKYCGAESKALGDVLGPLVTSYIDKLMINMTEMIKIPGPAMQESFEQLFQFLGETLQEAIQFYLSGRISNEAMQAFGKIVVKNFKLWSDLLQKQANQSSALLINQGIYFLIERGIEKYVLVYGGMSKLLDTIDNQVSFMEVDLEWMTHPSCLSDGKQAAQVWSLLGALGRSACQFASSTQTKNQGAKLGELSKTLIQQNGIAYTKDSADMKEYLSFCESLGKTQSKQGKRKPNQKVKKVSRREKEDEDEEEQVSISTGTSKRSSMRLQKKPTISYESSTEQTESDTDFETTPKRSRMSHEFESSPINFD